MVADLRGTVQVMDASTTGNAERVDGFPTVTPEATDLRDDALRS